MSVDLVAAREGLADLLSNLPGVTLVAHPYGPTITALPAVVIGQPQILRESGTVVGMFPVHVMVTKTGQARSERSLDELLADVWAAIDTDQTWNGAVRAGQVWGASPGGTDDVSNVEHFAYTMTARALVGTC